MRPGGEATIDNIELRCRAHNAYEAELDFGPSNFAMVREMGASYSFWNQYESSPRTKEVCADALQG